MKIIGIYRFDEELYSELIERLKLLDINVKPLADNQVEDGIDLYAFDVDSPDDFDIHFDKPFIIISSLIDSKFLHKSFKLGALDYIYKPFTDIDLTVKRIERVLDKESQEELIANTPQSLKCDKLIDIEIKRAHRGKYPLALAYINFDSSLSKEMLIKLVNKVKTVLRESDSCILYPDGKFYILLPFTDEDGTVIVARKIIELLNNIEYKSYCLCANYPEDGKTKEELIKNLGKRIDTRNLYK